MIAVRVRLVPLILVAGIVMALLPGITTAAHAAVVTPTSCEAQAGSHRLRPVLQLDVPTGANWANQTPPYSFDDTASIANGFDRVGYCLETTSASGTQWVWTDMEAFTNDPGMIGLHTKAGDITRQRVDDLNVASNVPGVATGTGMPGYLEMWPGSYEKPVSDQIAGASSTAYDADDVPTPGFYGSFQVHSVGDQPVSDVAPSTAFAINHFTGGGQLDIGIGNNPSGEPDWTFAGNAGSYTARTLTVFARPSTVTLTSAPQDRQLYPRDADNGANVRIAGTVDAPDVDAVRLTVTSTGTSETVEQTGSTFSFDRRITAGLHDYDFTLETVSGDTRRTVGDWTHVVSGDVYVIEGQSNAQATAYIEPGSREAYSPFLRSYGTNDFQTDVSKADRDWKYAAGDTFFNQGAVGQWGIRMARVISDTAKVPVAVFNGAHGGAAISFLQRKDSDPNDITTNYGRLRQRLVSSGTIDRLSGVLYYQGETESDDAKLHVDGFKELLADWRDDFGGTHGTNPGVYVTQVRTSPCFNSEAVALRDAQRRMRDALDVTVLSPTGLNNTDGCHFGWQNGYRLFGDQVAATLLRDLYDGPSDGVAAPNPVSASFTSPAADRIRVQLASKTDPLTVDPGSAADFRLRGSSATVTSVRYLSRGKLELELSGPALDVTSLAYVSHLGPGPMIRTSRGVGLLAFDALPVATTPAPELFDTIIDALQGFDARAGVLEEAGDLEAAERGHIGEVMASVQADVEAATPPDGSDDSTKPQQLIDALAAVQALRDQIRDANLDGPVLGELETRFTTIEQLLSKAVSRSLGVRIVLPPASSVTLPGAEVQGMVQLSNSGTEDLAGLVAGVTVDDWPIDAAGLGQDTLNAGQSIELPFTASVPRTQRPGQVEARATVTFTTSAGTFTVTEATPWIMVSSGVGIGGVDVVTAPGDPSEHATVAADVSNAATAAVRGHLVVEGPDGWGVSVPSADVTVEAGGSERVEVPVVIPGNVVGGDQAVKVRFEREGVVLASTQAAIPVSLPLPPSAATLDHVDFGNAASESAHGIQSDPRSGTNVEAGLTRRYANTSAPGSWFSAEVAVEAGKPFVLRNVETFDGARTKKFNVYVDDHLVTSEVVPRKDSGEGTLTYDLLVDDPQALDNDGTVRVKYEFPVGSSGFFDPSIADSWVLSVPADERAPDVGATVDSSAPQGDNGWYRGDASVTLHVSDHRDANPAVEFGGPDGWESYVAPVVVNGQGKHSVSYRAKDAAGNSTGERNVPVWIDSSAPSTDLATSRKAGESADEVTLAFTAHDGLSGVASTTYRVDGGDWQVLGGVAPVVRGFGSHTIDYFSTDVAGNTEAVATTVVELADVDVVTALVPPGITGKAVYRSTLTASTGTWNTTGLDYAYQWLRDGKSITGSTSAAYTVTAKDVGHRLSVEVTASKSGKAPASSTSTQTAKVARTGSKVSVG